MKINCPRLLPTRPKMKRMVPASTFRWLPQLIPRAPVPLVPVSVCPAAFVLFLQVIPFSITAFEVERWMVEDHEKQRLEAAAAALPPEPGTPDRKLSADLAHYNDPNHTHPSNGGNGYGGTMKVVEPAAEPSNGLAVVAVDQWATHGNRWADGREDGAAAQTADAAVDAAAVVVPEYGAVGRGWAPGTPRSMEGAGSLCGGSGSPGSSPEGSLARGSANRGLLTEAPGSVEGAPGRGADGGGGGGAGGDFVVQVTFARGEATTAAATAVAAAAECRQPSMSEAGGGGKVPVAAAAAQPLRAFPQRSTTGGAFMGGSGKGLRVAVGRGSTGGPGVRADGSVTFATSMPGGGGPGDVGRRGSTPHLIPGSRGRRLSGQQLGSRSHSGSIFGDVGGSGSAGSSGRSSRVTSGGRTGPGPVAEAVEEEQGVAAGATTGQQHARGEPTDIAAAGAGAGAERCHSIGITSPTQGVMAVAAPAVAPAAARQPRHVSLSGRYMPQQRPAARTVGGAPPPLPLPPSFPFPPPPPTAPASPPLPPARPNATLPPALDKVTRALPPAPSTVEAAKTADEAAAELPAGPAAAKPMPDNASEAPPPVKPQVIFGPPPPSRAASAGGATPDPPTPFQPPSEPGLGQSAGSTHQPNSQQLTDWLAFSRPSLDLPHTDACPAGVPLSLVTVGSGPLVSGRIVSSPGASPLPVLHRAASIAGCPVGHYTPPLASAVRWPYASMGGGIGGGSGRSLTLHREGPLLPSARSLNLPPRRSVEVRVAGATWAEGGAAEAAGWAAGGGGSGRLLPAPDSTTSSLLLSPRRSSLPAAAAVAAIAGRPDAFVALNGGGNRGATEGGGGRGREVSWSKAVLRLGPGSRVSSARVRAQQKHQQQQQQPDGEEVEFEFHKGSSKESWDGSGGSLNSFGSARSDGAGGSKGTGSFSMHGGKGPGLQQEQSRGREQGQGQGVRKNEAGVAGLLAELLGGWLPAVATSTAPATDSGGAARVRSIRTVGGGPRSADSALPVQASTANTVAAATATAAPGAGGNDDADVQAWRNGSSGGAVCGSAPSFTQGVLPVSPATTCSSAPPANPASSSEYPALQPSVSSPQQQQQPRQQPHQGPRGAADLEGLGFPGPTAGTRPPPPPLGATPAAAAPAAGAASVAHWPNVPTLGVGLPPRTSGAGTGVQPPPKGVVQGALPYGRVSGAGGAAGAAPGAPVVIPLGPAPSPPRASRRLLNPTVVACGDLPVPQVRIVALPSASVLRPGSAWAGWFRCV